MGKSLKIFDIPLGPGGKPGHLYNQQELRKKLWDLFQDQMSLNIANAQNAKVKVRNKAADKYNKKKYYFDYETAMDTWKHTKTINQSQRDAN